MKFIYTRINDEIRIDRIEDPEAIIYVPEQFEGCPVTELGSYVLAHSEVEEIHLPPYVRKIGAYGFYECEKLKRIYCYSRVLDLGAGLFAGVSAVEYLDITEFPGERSCLKEMLAELRQTLRVQLHQMLVEGEDAADWKQRQNEKEARLIFPEYYEDSVENTPARIVCIETHGCGHRYRYCFAGRVFQYRGYDELFPHVQVQEKEELVTELALGRLMYPRELSENSREHYRSYVKEHWKCAGTLLIRADRLQKNVVSNLEAGKLPWFVDEILNEEPEKEHMLGELVSLAQEAGDTEMVSWLMERRHRLSRLVTSENQQQPKRKRRFEL